MTNNIWKLDKNNSTHNSEWWIKQKTNISYDRIVLVFKMSNNKRTSTIVRADYTALKKVSNINVNAYVYTPDELYEILNHYKITFNKYENIIDYYDLNNKKIKFINYVSDLYE